MTTVHTRVWQTEIVRGILTLGFGVIFLLLHVHTLRVLLYLLGTYLIIDSVTDIAGLVTRRRIYRRAWLDGLISVGSLILGVISLVLPHITLLFLLSMLAVRLALRGGHLLRQAWRSGGEYNGLTWLLGIGMILIGIVLFRAPRTTLAFIVIFIPLYVIGDGGTMLVRGMYLRFAPERYLQRTMRTIDHDADIPTDKPATTRRGVVYVRRAGASGLGHIGWAFEWYNGWFNAGSVENTSGKPFAQPDAMDFWSVHTLEPVAAMQRQLVPYDEYKVFLIDAPHPKDAWKTVIWESRTPYSVLRHNCNDVVYDILRAYGVGDLLDPAEEHVPNDWYDALPGLSFTIPAHPVIPTHVRRLSQRPLPTTTIALTIPAHVPDMPPHWHGRGLRAWEEIILAWEKMLRDVQLLFASRLWQGASVTTPMAKDVSQKVSVPDRTSE